MLLFGNKKHKTGHKKYFLLNVEIKDCNLMIDGRKFFDQTIRNDVKTYENTRKIATSQGNHYHVVNSQSQICFDLLYCYI